MHGEGPALATHGRASLRAGAALHDLLVQLLVDGLDRAVDLGIGWAELVRYQLHQKIDAVGARIVAEVTAEVDNLPAYKALADVRATKDHSEAVLDLIDRPDSPCSADADLARAAKDEVSALFSWID